MRKILLSLIIAVSLVSLARAEDAMTGEKADQVKAEIMKLETEKAATLLKNGDAAADWRVTHDSDQVVTVRSNGISANKAESVAKLRSGELFLISQKQFGHHVDVYDDGNVAVCTFYTDGVMRRNGKPVPVKTADTDVWSKFEDGQWRRIVHDVTPVTSIPGQ